MTDTGPEIAQDIHDTCHANEEQIAAVVGEVFESSVQISVGEATEFELESPPDGFDGPGLLLLFQLEQLSALLFVPQASYVPDWCTESNPDIRKRLLDLASQLAPKMLPDAKPEDVAIAFVDKLSAGLRAGKVASGASLLPIEINGADSAGAMHLVWPAEDAGKVLELLGHEEISHAVQNDSSDSSSANPARDFHYDDFEDGVRYLPQYSRSLLRIKVPVVVKLAGTHEPIKRIMELGPGTMIQFEKSCEEMLDLEVGNQRIAVGEAVKVGDKFGLRVTSMVMPHERFKKVSTTP